MENNKHVKAFYHLKCCTDILKVVEPVNNLEKEITETMAVINKLKSYIFHSDLENARILDVCAGNGLLGVTISHLFPKVTVHSIDILPRHRSWNQVKGFKYITEDFAVYKRLMHNSLIPYDVIIASHPCRIAIDIIEAFNISLHVKVLILLPCCEGITKGVPKLIRSKLGRHLTWVYSLYDAIDSQEGDVTKHLYQDKNCLSPGHYVINAKKRILNKIG